MGGTGGWEAQRTRETYGNELSGVHCNLAAFHGWAPPVYHWGLNLSLIPALWKYDTHGIIAGMKIISLWNIYEYLDFSAPKMDVFRLGMKPFTNFTLTVFLSKGGFNTWRKIHKSSLWEGIFQLFPVLFQDKQNLSNMFYFLKQATHTRERFLFKWNSKQLSQLKTLGPASITMNCGNLGEKQMDLTRPKFWKF